MAAIDQAYLSRRQFAVIVRMPSGQRSVYANFASRAAADNLAHQLGKRGMYACVKIDPRLSQDERQLEHAQ
jgi:hypothetical protein